MSTVETFVDWGLYKGLCRLAKWLRVLQFQLQAGDTKHRTQDYSVAVLCATTEMHHNLIEDIINPGYQVDTIITHVYLLNLHFN